MGYSARRGFTNGKVSGAARQAEMQQKLQQMQEQMTAAQEAVEAQVFTASVGLNGVGLKAVNALSQKFVARSHRDGQYHEATFEYGKLISDNYGETTEEDGTYIYFEPDPQQFRNFRV